MVVLTTGSMPQSRVLHNIWLTVTLPMVVLCTATNTTETALRFTAHTSSSTRAVSPTVDSLHGHIDVSTCGETKGCLRVPAGCESLDCQHIVTWQADDDGNTIRFELGALSKQNPPWIALGFSEDMLMPKTSVVDCIVSPWSAENITIQASYNPGYYNEVLEPNNQVGLVPEKSSASYQDGFLACRFTKLTHVNSSEVNSSKVADLRNRYHLFLAEGQTKPNGEKHKHSQIPYQSAQKISVFDNIDVSIGREKVFIVTHATLMILSWMFLSSVGIVSSRHFKSAWNSRLCGQKAWFQIHRVLMSLTALLTVIALTLIFLAEKLVPLQEQELHPILGMIVACLMLINALLGLFRPHPGTAHRPLFNWVHCLIGNGAHLTAVVAMFFGVELLSDRGQVPGWTRWVVVAFGAWRVVIEIAMTAQKYYSREDLQMAYVEISGSADDTQVETEAFRFKTVMVVVYLCGVLGCTVAVLSGILQAFVSKN